MPSHTVSQSQESEAEEEGASGVNMDAPMDFGSNADRAAALGVNGQESAEQMDGESEHAEVSTPGGGSGIQASDESPRLSALASTYLTECKRIAALVFRPGSLIELPKLKGRNLRKLTSLEEQMLAKYEEATTAFDDFIAYVKSGDISLSDAKSTLASVKKAASQLWSAHKAISGSYQYNSATTKKIRIGLKRFRKRLSAAIASVGE